MSSKPYLVIFPVIDVDAVNADGDALVVAAEVGRVRPVAKRLLEEDGWKLEGGGGQVEEVVPEKVVAGSGFKYLQTFKKRAQSFVVVKHQVVAVGAIHQLFSKEKLSTLMEVLKKRRFYYLQITEKAKIIKMALGFVCWPTQKTNVIM